MRLNAAGDGPENRIVTVKRGEKTEPWQIDGITGATVSSVAIGEMLAESTIYWLPVINAGLDTLQAGGDDGAD